MPFGDRLSAVVVDTLATVDHEALGTNRIEPTPYVKREGISLFLAGKLHFRFVSGISL
jgi:hypothetical protein